MTAPNGKATANSSPSSRPQLSDEEFANSSAQIIDDYFVIMDQNGLVDALKRLTCPRSHDVFARMLLRKAFDQPESGQEAASNLVTALVDRKVLTRPQLERAFMRLIDQAEDQRLDFPDYEGTVLLFLAIAREAKIVPDDTFARLPLKFLVNLHEDIVAEYDLGLQIEQLQTYKEELEDFCIDFFNSGAPDDCRAFFKKHPEAHLRHEVLRVLVRRSLDRNDRFRESVSFALSNLLEDQTLTTRDIDLAFARTLAEIDDIELDCPGACGYLANFLARAIVDDCLAPSFLTDYRRLHFGGERGMEVLDRVKSWTMDKRHMLGAKFQKVWTGTDPDRFEAQQFKHTIKQIIFKYFEDLNVERAVKEIGLLDLSPGQNEETVRKALHYGMEEGEGEMKLALKLVAGLLEEQEVSAEEVVNGFAQLEKRMDDIVKDLPYAATRMQELKSEAQKLEINLFATEPQRAL